MSGNLIHHRYALWGSGYRVQVGSREDRLIQALESEFRVKAGKPAGLGAYPPEPFQTEVVEGGVRG